ncbi:amidohydrolase family protein [Micromonospora sp. FIMYZ51]|uniref:amidohydrolase family protein n=1 Tax=Micromonospora sp. FIMYZ51 TaxID=3051832 RepID=UPI00311F8A66
MAAGRSAGLREREIRRGVRENIRTGADQIKVMASGGAMSPADELDTIQYSPEELRMAVQTATAAGKYVLAHAYSSAAIRNCVEAGVRSIEHGNLMDEATAALLAEAGTYLVPTLSTYELLHRQGAEHGVAPEPLEKIRMAHEQGLRSLEYAYRAGVRIASGSDLLGPMFEHKHRELSLKAEIMPTTRQRYAGSSGSPRAAAGWPRSCRYTSATSWWRSTPTARRSASTRWCTGAR